MNLSDEVDLEAYVSRPDKLSGAEIQVGFGYTCAALHAVSQRAGKIPVSQTGSQSIQKVHGFRRRLAVVAAVPSTAAGPCALAPLPPPATGLARLTGLSVLCIFALPDRWPLCCCAGDLPRGGDAGGAEESVRSAPSLRRATHGP